jgi:hypothetical protein
MHLESSHKKGDEFSVYSSIAYKMFICDPYVVKKEILCTEVRSNYFLILISSIIKLELFNRQKSKLHEVSAQVHEPIQEAQLLNFLRYNVQTEAQSINYMNLLLKSAMSSQVTSA